jgi:hypothetical protein
MSILGKKRIKKGIFFLFTAAFSITWFVLKAVFHIIIEMNSDSQDDDPEHNQGNDSHPADGINTFGLDYDPSDTPMDTKDYM